MGHLKTAIVWTENGEEREAYVGVRYTGHKGFPGSYIDPPEPASVEIGDVKVLEGDPLPADWEPSDELLAECLQDWHEEAMEAAEYRAEAARDRLMEGF